jgi:hypothetical protein
LEEQEEISAEWEAKIHAFRHDLDGLSDTELDRGLEAAGGSRGGSPGSAQPEVTDESC